MAPSAPTRPAERAVPLSRFAVFFGLAILGCAADLFSKEAVFAWRGAPRAENEWWIVENFFGIETSLNLGALFGMGRGYSGLFAALSIGAGLAILFWLFVAGAARDRWLTVALGAVMAGILGNLYDRLGWYDYPWLAPEYEHAVRDWILFRYKTYTWPNFNLADCFLVCGAILLVIHSFWFKPDEPAKPEENVPRHA